MEMQKAKGSESRCHAGVFRGGDDNTLIFFFFSPYDWLTHAEMIQI